MAIDLFYLFTCCSSCILLPPTSPQNLTNKSTIQVNISQRTSHKMSLCTRYNIHVFIRYAVIRCFYTWQVQAWALACITDRAGFMLCTQVGSVFRNHGQYLQMTSYHKNWTFLGIRNFFADSGHNHKLHHKTCSQLLVLWCADSQGS